MKLSRKTFWGVGGVLTVTGVALTRAAETGLIQNYRQLMVLAGIALAIVGLYFLTKAVTYRSD